MCCWPSCKLQSIDPMLPWGGYKASGIGREGGKWAIETFTQVPSLALSCSIICFLVPPTVVCRDDCTNCGPRMLLAMTGEVGVHQA
jgi:Aldehyde dehydrogenase family